ncbi:MAG: SBBP repeat-containing protein, partial [Acidobacteria bacterium]|nr:SBBP repeat-containing protein [Acidobacteriota bacterium]
GGGAERREVAVHYVLGAGNQIGFGLGRYDRRQELVIDPVLAYSTYLGGTGGDIGYGIAVDSSGNAYITGITNSSDFPARITARTYQGNGDVFVAKLNPTGSTAVGTSTPQLVYSTYLGGTGTDSGAAIAVNAGGDAFITGSTTSSNFPTASSASTGPFQSFYKGGGDAFIAQLDSTGATLNYSSYLGGSEADFGLGITVDSSNNAYVTGSTQSVDFPTSSPLQATNAGSSDAFVAKVNFTGSQLLYATYLGGTGADVGQSIRVDGSGNAYVAGYTFSTDFPLQNPVQGANAGTVNAFVSEINPAGTALSFSTYLGGSSSDRAYGVAVDGNGNVYVAGAAQSSDFPTTSGAFQTANHGQLDAFVAKLKPSGPTLVYSTLLGGSGIDQANGIAVDSSGDAFITGFTQSNDFPTQNPVQSILGITSGGLCGSTVCADAFVSELNPTGSGLIESTYLGGSGADFGQGIALGPTGDPYITGSTSSTNFPAIAGAVQSSLNGVAGNAFVAEIDSANAPGIVLVPATLDFGNQTLSVRSSVQSVMVVDEGTAPLTISKITFAETDSTGNTDFAETDNCVGTLAASGGSCTIDITFTPSSLGVETGQFSITDNASGSPHVIDVKGSGVTSATAVTLTPSSLSFGSVTVGGSSSPQSVTVTNTGTQTLNISGISASGDFTQTNTCGALLNTLAPGQSCSVSVTFTPTASGGRSGALSVSDNAVGSPQTVVLSGTGAAVFTVTSSSSNVSVLIGNTTATMTVSATAPSSFTGKITLTCPSSLTCSFNPASIFAGQTSTLTISNLTTSMPNPFAFTVTGTSGSQAATLSSNLLFEDYSLSASPSLNTIVSGGAATYTMVVTPVNGFNKQVQLACGAGMPPGATCSFSSSSVTPQGGSASVTLKIQTSKTGLVPPPSVIPPGSIPFLILCLFVLVVLSLFALARKRTRFPGLAGQRWVRAQVSLLCLLILFEVFSGACRNSTVPSSTTTGNYSVTITGTLGSNSTVVRSTIINLAVT